MLEISKKYSLQLFVTLCTCFANITNSCINKTKDFIKKVLGPPVCTTYMFKYFDGLHDSTSCFCVAQCGGNYGGTPPAMVSASHFHHRHTLKIYSREHIQTRLASKQKFRQGIKTCCAHASLTSLSLQIKYSVYLGKNGEEIKNSLFNFSLISQVSLCREWGQTEKKHGGSED